MPRVGRVVIADVAHQVTQRGNGRQCILATDAEREVYLDLLRREVGGRELSVAGYCLMSNHVHLVVIPSRAEGLGRRVSGEGCQRRRRVSGTLSPPFSPFSSDYSIFPENKRVPDTLLPLSPCPRVAGKGT